MAIEDPVVSCNAAPRIDLTAQVAAFDQSCAENAETNLVLTGAKRPHAPDFLEHFELSHRYLDCSGRAVLGRGSEVNPTSE